MGSSTFINQEIQMYLVGVDRNGIAGHLTRVGAKGCKKSCKSNTVDGTEENQ